VHDGRIASSDTGKRNAWKTARDVAPIANTRSIGIALWTARPFTAAAMMEWTAPARRVQNRVLSMILDPALTAGHTECRLH